MEGRRGKWRDMGNLERGQEETRRTCDREQNGSSLLLLGSCKQERVPDDQINLCVWSRSVAFSLFFSSSAPAFQT